jgi:hypothetical protein
MDKRLDWKPRFDERSKSYGIGPLIGTDRPKKRATFWQEGTVLDQGQEGACVGFGWLAELLAKPAPPDEQPSEELGNKIARFYYHEAKKIDEWEGEDYEGTSVLAGAKVMHRYGFISEYRWCFDIDDIINVVVANGPVVIGIPWYESMYRTNRDGLCDVSGNIVGGHCITITGYDPAMAFGRQTLEVFRWRNSWGTGYGKGGSGYIRVSDLRKLFAEGGEACVPVVRNKPAIAYPPVSIIKKRTFWDILLTAIVQWFRFRFTTKCD